MKKITTGFLVLSFCLLLGLNQTANARQHSPNKSNRHSVGYQYSYRVPPPPPSVQYRGHHSIHPRVNVIYSSNCRRSCYNCRSGWGSGWGSGIFNFHISI